ncbi:hypothetical protein PDL09_06065 [Bacillus cereus]|nr:hypothetical protein [Bacillus cereus]
MLKQIKDINELVLMWDLDGNLRNEKLSTLMKWKEDLEEEEFEVVLKICNHFNYYSERKTAHVYKSVFEEKICSMESVDVFIKKSMFMPLRRKDRIESAIGMLLSFIYLNNIDVNRTNVNGPVDYLKKYKDKKESASKIVEECDQEDSVDDAAILNLQEKSAIQSNQKVKSKIEKQISGLQARKAKRAKRLNALVKEYDEKYHSVKNLIIIDDFIGTGQSVIKLLNQIGEITKDSDIGTKLYFLVIEASKSGMEEIEKTAKRLNIEIQISFYKISTDVLEENMVFSSDNIDQIKEMISNINKKNKLRKSEYCRNHAIASFINAPNNNLTLLSKENANWKALFLRKTRNNDREEKDSDELKDAMQSLRK